VYHFMIGYAAWTEPACGWGRQLSGSGEKREAGGQSVGMRTAGLSSLPPEVPRAAVNGRYPGLPGGRLPRPVTAALSVPSSVADGYPQDRP